MHCRVLVPTDVLFDGPVAKVVAEGPGGSFCLLPRHADCASALVPGLLDIWTPDGTARVYAVDEGVLVKCGPDLLVSVLDAVLADDTSGLPHAILERLRVLDDQQRVGRTALARLEAGALKRFLALQEVARGR